MSDDSLQADLWQLLDTALSQHRDIVKALSATLIKAGAQPEDIAGLIEEYSTDNTAAIDPQEESKARAESQRQAG